MAFLKLLLVGFTTFALQTTVATEPTIGGTIPQCDINCMKRLLYKTAYSSATTGFNIVFGACDAYDWCINDAKEWCPEAINSTITSVAGTLVTSSGIDYNNTDNITLLSTMSTISSKATRMATSLAQSLLNDSSVVCDRNRTEDLRKTRWSLSKQEGPIDYDARMFDNEITNIDPDEAKQSKSHHGNKGLAIGLPFLAAPAALLGPLVGYGTCIADPVLCNAITSKFLRRFFEAARKVLPKPNLLRYIVEEEAELGSDVASTVSDGKESLQRFLEQEPGEVPDWWWDTPSDETLPLPGESAPYQPPNGSPFPDHTLQPPLDPIPEEEEEPAEPPRPQPNGPQEPQQPQPIDGPGEPPVSVPDDDEKTQNSDEEGTDETDPDGETEDDPVDGQPKEPQPPESPGEPPVPVPEEEPPVNQPGSPEQPPIEPPGTAPVPEAPIPGPPVPEAPVTAPAEAIKLFRGEKYDVFDNVMEQQTLRQITNTEQAAELLRKAGRTFSSTKELPFELLDSTGNVLRTVWRDPKTLAPMAGEWMQQGNQYVRIAERMEPVLDSLGEPLIASSAGTLMTLEPAAVGATEAAAGVAEGVVGAASVLFSMFLPEGGQPSQPSLDFNPVSGVVKLASDVKDDHLQGSNDGSDEQHAKQSDDHHDSSNDKAEPSKDSDDRKVADHDKNKPESDGNDHTSASNADSTSVPETTRSIETSKQATTTSETQNNDKPSSKETQASPTNRGKNKPESDGNDSTSFSDNGSTTVPETTRPTETTKQATTPGATHADDDSSSKATQASPTVQKTATTSIKWVTSTIKSVKSVTSTTLVTSTLLQSTFVTKTKSNQSKTVTSGIPAAVTTITGCQDINGCQLCSPGVECHIGDLPPACVCDALGMESLEISGKQQREDCRSSLLKLTREEAKAWVVNITPDKCLSGSEWRPNEYGVDCHRVIKGFDRYEGGVWISGMLPLACPYGDDGGNWEGYSDDLRHNCTKVAKTLDKAFKD
jgi:hypothetical protein